MFFRKKPESPLHQTGANLEDLTSKKEVAVAEKPRPKQKIEAEIVKEIHDSYDAAQEELLSEARKILGIKVRDEEKAKRMAALGFINTSVVKDTEDILKQKEANLELARTIEYYAINYPQYKFITMDKVVDINKKYGLVFGEVSRYKGDIPEKNLREIENFKVKEKDLLVAFQITSRGKWDIDTNTIYLTIQDAESRKKAWGKGGYTTCRVFKAPLFISAPAHEMELKRNERVDSEGLIYSVNEDPIVMARVKGGLLIASKWGIEGQDKDLVNEQSN
jgi:hypothetical protein